ncbi:MAG: leucine-rich repeat domain-containing protein, partial [Bacilli bacterium]|nr:leucine-rich repeat domain-containing protein [Bacilli bacterium]
EIIIPPAQKELFTWDSDTVISGLTADGIAEVKANGGHLVIPEGVTEITGASFDMVTGEGEFDKGFSPYAIGQLDINTATEEQIIENSIITSVSLPSTLTKIGSAAFFRTNIAEMVFPNALREIGDGAFFLSSISGELILPNNLIIIGPMAFGNTKISGELVIPDNVTEIGFLAFAELSITSLRIGNNVRNIREQAFAYCVNLSGELFIPDSVVEIGDYAFVNGVSAPNKITNISISKNTIYDTHTFEDRPTPVIRQ